MLDDFAVRFRVGRMVWASHEDKENFHVHGLVFAQDAQGRKLRLETKVGDRVQAVAPSLRRLAVDWEDRLGTRKTGRSPVPGMSVAKDTLEMAQRQHAAGKAPTPIPAKLQLRAAVERIVALSGSFADLQSHAAAEGVEIRFTQHPNGTGVSFSDGNVSLRGREAGFTFQTLTQLFHEPHPRIERCQPTIGVAEGDRPRHRRPAPPRAGETDRHPRQGLGDAVVRHGGEPGIYRDLEKTLRTLSGMGNDGGLLGFLGFLTAALDRLATDADSRNPASWTRRPSL